MDALRSLTGKVVYFNRDTLHLHSIKQLLGSDTEKPTVFSTARFENRFTARPIQDYWFCGGSSVDHHNPYTGFTSPSNTVGMHVQSYVMGGCGDVNMIRRR